MSIFAKKQESDQKAADGGGMPPSPPVTTSRNGYGIAEAIQLLRGLPSTRIRTWWCASSAPRWRRSAST